MYRGDVIEESLQDPSVIKDLHIVGTRVEQVTPDHKTPWLKQWTLHTIEVDEAHAAQLAERLSHALQAKYWYIDFKNDEKHYIIFNGKVFAVDRNRPAEYKEVVDYGLSLSIPRHQLDFSPAITEWRRDAR